MIVGCYSMYDGPSSKQACKAGYLAVMGNQQRFTGETAGECRRKARAAGWKLDVMNHLCRCRQCAEISP